MEKFPIPAETTLNGLADPILGLLLWGFVFMLLVTAAIAAISWVQNHNKPDVMKEIFDSVKVFAAATAVVGLVYGGAFFAVLNGWTGFHLGH